MSWASRGLGRPFNWASRGLGIKVLDRPGCLDVEIRNPSASVELLSTEQLISILEAEISFEVLKQLEVTVRSSTIECGAIRAPSISLRIIRQLAAEVVGAAISVSSSSASASGSAQSGSVSAETLQASATVEIDENCDP